MNHFSSPVEVWALGASDFSEAWVSAFGPFALSCLPAFLILSPVPVFRLYSVALRLCGQSWFKAVLKGFKEI